MRTGQERVLGYPTPPLFLTLTTQTYLCSPAALILPQPVVVMDEPLTGLDSAAAEKVMSVVTSLSSTRTVIITRHQVDRVDGRIAAVKDGRIIFEGTQRELESKFHVTGVEDFVDLISQDGFTAPFASSSSPPSAVAIYEKAGKTATRPRSNPLRQLVALCKRSVLGQWRNRSAIYIKFMTNAMVGVIYGCLYDVSKNNQESVYDRFGLLSLLAIGTLNLGLASTVRKFPEEKVRR